MTREELKQKQYEEKVAKGLKALKGRKFKNFLFWLLGVVCLPIVIILTTFIGIKVLPMSVYFGGEETQYVSENISSKSLLDAVLSFNDYTFDELVFVEDLITELENTDIGDGKKLGDWVSFDTEKLKGLHFTEIASVLSSCVVINASLDNTVGLELLGDIGNISAFSTWESVPNQTAEGLSSFDLSVETCNPNLYWIPVGIDTGVSPLSTGGNTSVGGQGEYESAFQVNQDGSFIVQNGKYLLKNGAWGNLCYANVSKVPFTIVVDIIDETLSRVAFKDILGLVGIQQPGEGENNVLFTILGDKKIGDLSGDFKIEDFIGDITLEGLGVSELLGDFNQLSLFSWQPHDMSVEIDTTSESFNPKLYYYVANENFDANGALLNSSYELAFEDIDGDGVYNLKLDAQDPNPKQLYYANLSSVPVLDLLTLINESINRIEFDEVLEFAGISGENNLIVQILGDFKDISLFNWQPHDMSVEIDTTSESFNPKLYYYIANENFDETGALLNSSYELAFEDIDGDGVYSLKSGANGAQLYYANLSCVPILDVLTLVNESINRIQLDEVLELAGITDQENLIFKILGGKTIGDFSGEFKAEDLLGDFSLNDLGVGELLGDFGTLNIFSWQPVDLGISIDPLAENFNPKLYYYVANNDLDENGILKDSAYELAFEDTDGDGVYLLKNGLAGVQLYYANLSSVPVLDLLTLINESINRIEIDKVLELAEITGENNIIVQIFSGMTVGDFATGVDVDKLLGKVSLNSIEGGMKALGDIASLSVISSWEFAGYSGDIKPNVRGFNHKLYYYVAHPEDNELGMPNDSAYELAFEDADGDGVYSLKAGINPETAPIYYAKLACVPLSDLTKILGESIDRIKFDEILRLAGIQEPTGEGQSNILYDILSGKTIHDISGDFNAQDILSEVTLEDLGGTQILGDIGELSMFKVWEEAGLARDIDTSSENFNPKLYYYVAYPENVENGMRLDSAYALAFEDLGDGYQLKEDVDPYSTPIYYAKLSCIPFMDMTQLLSENLGRLEVIDLLNNLGGAGITEGSLVYDILSGATLNQLGDLSEKIDGIKLSSILPRNANNEELYKILDAVLDKGGDEFINVKDLSSFKIDNLQLETVLPRDEKNAELYKILDEVIDKGSDGAINVSDLSSFKIDDISLETVLPRNQKNAELYKILDEVIDKGSDGAINVSDLSSFKIDDISLSTVVDASKNEKLFSILVEGINEKRKTDGDSTNDSDVVSSSNVALGDISDFSIDGIKLSTVLTPNANLKTILEQMTGKDFSDIKISTLSGNLQFDNIKLSTVIDQSANQKLFDILVEGINGKRLSDSDATNDTLVSASNLSISDISDFGVDNIKLSTVLTPKDNLKTILEQMTGEDFDNISISTLSGNLNFDNIYLSTVMPYNESTNKTLYSVLLQGTGKNVSDANIASLASTLKISDIQGGIDFSNIRLSTVLKKSVHGADEQDDVLDMLLNDETVTLGNIHDKISNLDVLEMYNVTCFVEDSTSAKAKYYKDAEGNFYLVGGEKTPSELTGSTTYSISKNGKIWLFLAYETGYEINGEVKTTLFDNKGNALFYNYKDLKFKDISSSITGMTSGILDATIRQLEDSGILTGPYNDLLYPQSISHIIDTANGNLPVIPIP